MSRISRQSARVLGGLVVCCVLGLASACSDSNNAPTGEAVAVEAAPPAVDDPGAAEEAAPAEEPSTEPGASGEGEEVPVPEEGAETPEETAPPEAAPNS